MGITDRREYRGEGKELILGKTLPYTKDVQGFYLLLITLQVRFHYFHFRELLKVTCHLDLSALKFTRFVVGDVSFLIRSNLLLTKKSILGTLNIKL